MKQLNLLFIALTFVASSAFAQQQMSDEDLAIGVTVDGMSMQEMIAVAESKGISTCELELKIQTVKLEIVREIMTVDDSEEVKRSFNILDQRVKEFTEICSH